MNKLYTVFIFLFLILARVAVASPDVYENSLYMEGYITNLLIKSYNLSTDVQVRKGIVYLPDSVSGNENYESIVEEINSVRGVKEIKLVPDAELSRIGKVWVLPYDTLFAPLVADLKYPRFSAAYNYYADNIDFRNTFEGTFGKSFSLFRSGLGRSVYSEIGFDAAVFAMFDLDTTSFDLINADYMIGIPVTFQWEPVTVKTRIYHQSSHLGDEYLLGAPGTERINLSYEVFDLLVSYNPKEWLRVYGGGGFILHRDPATYGRWLYQTGIEGRIVSDDPMVPTTVLALDVKGSEETGFTPSWSFVIGVEVSEKFTFSVDVYHGFSPHGQFYADRITTIGVGLSFY